MNHEARNSITEIEHLFHATFTKLEFAKTSLQTVVCLLRCEDALVSKTNTPLELNFGILTQLKYLLMSFSVPLMSSQMEEMDIRDKMVAMGPMHQTVVLR